ncbi:MAG: DUF58 domain-containing protein [Terriglobales bacterium]
MPRSQRPPAEWTWRHGLMVSAGLGGAFLLAVAAGFVPPGVLRAALAAASLLVLGVISLISLPPLFRRSILGRWMRGRVQYRFTAAGLPFLVALLILLVAAINSGNNLLYLIVAAFLAALATSGLASALNLSGMALHFQMPAHIFAGEDTPVELTLENEKAVLPSYSVTVTGNARRLVPLSAPLRTRRRRLRGRRRSDLASGELEVQPAYFPYVPRRSRATVCSTVRFPQRGCYSSAAFALGTRYPFALIDKSRPFRSADGGGSLLVYPSLARDARLLTTLPLGVGEQVRPRPGAGQDLYRVRPLQPGDSSRLVHWKASAKTGYLRVREFSREEDRRVHLVFALGAGDYSDAQAERAITLCASLVAELAETEIWLTFEGLNPVAGNEPDAAATAGPVFPLAPAAQLLYPILQYLALVQVGGQTRAATLSLAQVELVVTFCGSRAELPPLAGAAQRVDYIAMEL